MSEATKPPTPHQASSLQNQKKRGKRPHPNNKYSRRGRPRRQYQHGRNKPTEPPSSSKPKCSECQAEEPKYKCPKCRAPYCSIACCRAHKEKPCNKPDESNDETKSVKSKYLPFDIAVSGVTTNKQHCTGKDQFDDLDQEWKITDTMKLAMEQTPWLRNELKDGGLKQIIGDIVSKCSHPSSNDNHESCTYLQGTALEQAKKKYPNFETFMDKLLVVTGVLERESRDEDLSEWLTRNSHDDLGRLVMKSVERKRKALKKQVEEKESLGSMSNDDDDNDDSSSIDDDSSTSDSSSSYQSPRNSDEGKG